MIYKKKGQLDTPVVMIFAVVTGVMILLGVGYFVLRQQGNAENERELISLNNLRTSFESLSGSPNVKMNLSVVGGEYNFNCGPNQPMSVIYERGNEQQLPDMILFAPRALNGEVIQATTAASGDVYKVGNIVYLLSPSNTIEKGDALPDFPFETGVGSAGVDFITHTHNGVSRTVKEVQATQSGLKPRVGTVTFSDTPGGTPTGSRIYLNTELLAGAAVAADVELYSCALEQYLRKLAFTTEMQLKRVEQIRGRYADVDATTGVLTVNNNCYYYYSEQPFIEILDVLQNRANPAAITWKPFDTLTVTDAEKIDTSLESIARMNREIIRADRCAVIS